MISLLALILVAVAVAIFSIFFLPAIFEALLNGVILYFLFLKTYADIKKRRMQRMYILAAIVSAVFLAIVGNMFPVWMFTTWAILTMFIVVLIRIMLTKKSTKY